MSWSMGTNLNCPEIPTRTAFFVTTDPCSPALLHAISAFAKYVPHVYIKIRGGLVTIKVFQPSSSQIKLRS